MDNQIKIRVDEWATKIETTPEGTFIYIDESIKEEVLEEMERVLQVYVLRDIPCESDQDDELSGLRSYLKKGLEVGCG